MSKLFYFSSRIEIDARQNLGVFITQCRDDLTVFGTDLNWDHWLWPKVANFTKLGSGSRSISVEDRMDEPFISFAKAYFRYQQGHNPTGTKNESKALKVLEFVLSERGGAPDIVALDTTLLDRAVEVAREHFDKTAYQCGRELERLAKFVSANKLVSKACGDWRNPILRPKDSDRVGKKAREERDRKLPSPEAVLAMADIFSTSSENPKDIFTSSVFSLLMSGSVRITELLELPADCEVHDTDKDGNSVYGLRFFSGKGFGGNVKWVPSVMVSVVQEAISRIRMLTEEGRALALWLESNPDSMYMHPDFPHIDRSMPITEIEACKALGFDLDHSDSCQRIYYLYKFCRSKILTIDNLWSAIKSRMPKDFPWVNKQAGIKYSNALFSMQDNALHSRRGTLRVIPWRPDVNIVNNDLSPRHSVGKGLHKSIFMRFGFQYSDGSEMKITTHQMRHMIDTMGHRGGMSEDEIARFAGRADPKQNRVYNHVSASELADKYEKIQASLAYDKSTLIHCEPVDRAAYDLAPKGAIHKTRYGFCVHDFSAAPCGMFRDCLNCDEHLCEKRASSADRLKLELSDIEEQLIESEAAMNEGHYGADRWYEHHLLSTARLRELVSIMENLNVNEHTLIRFKQNYSSSHATRALIVRGDKVSGRLDETTASRLTALLERM